jgi:tRNA A-37 threonylcarbamoyl transferase component Bud32
VGDATPVSDPSDSPPGSTPTLMPGTTVGDEFRVEGVIGAGGMGVVYKARHVKLDRLVAIKLQRTHREDTARLEREARAMARLSHPHVVAVYDVGTWGNDVYIAMEYVDGLSARKWLRERPRPWREKLEMLLQAGEGLRAAHEVGLVHRDFKPDNVLVGRDGRARVADFGLARALGAQGDLGPDLTTTGSFPGTPAYMAPEQFSGPVDGRADLFAFCVVLFEALYGMRPFAGNNLGELLYNVTAGRIQSPPARDVPRALHRVVLSGLASDPARRPANMAVLLGELRRAVTVADQRSGAPKFVAAGIAAVVALSVGGGVIAWRAWGTEAATASTTGLTSPRVEQQALEPLLPAVERDDDEGADAGEPEVAEEVDGVPPPVDDKEARKKAALEKLRNFDPEDPESLDEFVAAMEGLDEVSEAEMQAAIMGMVTRQIGEAMSDAKKAQDAAAAVEPDKAAIDAKPFVTPAWDGRSTLSCGIDDRYEIRGRTIEVVDRPVFSVGWGCTLQVIDCTIRAPKVVDGTNANVVLEGGSYTVSGTMVNLVNGRIELRSIEMTEPARTVLHLRGVAKAVVKDSVLRGTTVIEAEGSTRTRLVDSKIIGSDLAVKAIGGSIVELENSSHEGKIDKGGSAGVIVVAPGTPIK